MILLYSIMICPLTCPDSFPLIEVTLYFERNSHWLDFTHRFHSSLKLNTLKGMLAPFHVFVFAYIKLKHPHYPVYSNTCKLELIIYQLVSNARS